MVNNVHQREFRATEAQLGDLLDRVAEPNGPLWPRRWPPMVLRGPLGVGVTGGHGPISYRVAEYEPGRRVVFAFTEPTPLQGTHSLEVRAGSRPGTAVLRHDLVGRLVGLGVLSWPLVIRWLHDAVLKELLDRAGYAVGDPPARPVRWSAWVRVCRRLLGAGSAAPVGH
ncbi:MAG TPA: SRPBCC family protein [Pseudonocardia sp.]|jgi:hypothetical protein|nr:SRPBCC family protein [Pseudonocardia sp.]